MQRSSECPQLIGQPHQQSSSLSDERPAYDASPFRKAKPEELDQLTSQQIARELNSSLNGLSSRATGASGSKPRRVPEEDNDGEGSTEHRTKSVAPDASSEKEIAQLENGRLIELERQLSKTLAAQTERDRRIGQLTDKLAQVTEEKKQEVRELQMKLDELLLSRNQAEGSVAEEKRHAGLELRELQAKFDGLLLSRDQAEANTAEAKKRVELEKRELQIKLDELQAKLGELMLSRDEDLRTLEQAQSALQKATSRAADADERGQRTYEHETELAELRSELQGQKSELAAVCLQLTEAEDGWTKSKIEADALRAGTQAAAGLVNMDVDRVMRKVMECVRAMEAEVASLRGDEKSIKEMECRNEG